MDRSVLQRSFVRTCHSFPYGPFPLLLLSGNPGYLPASRPYTTQCYVYLDCAMRALPPRRCTRFPYCQLPRMTTLTRTWASQPHLRFAWEACAHASTVFGNSAPQSDVTRRCAKQGQIATTRPLNKSASAQRPDQLFPFSPPSHHIPLAPWHMAATLQTTL